ncbi:E3 ubiquitin-protein ligase PRT1-like isoform X2 [Rutidosis leptorrhynchoides]|uniref:E3 ubiquitin-protein ligase PRT1-like isoform X2 n=1 Tax=Rutidosis leptorrhynchoides TaxID=125765 RepID=UPI003A98E86D
MNNKYFTYNGTRIIWDVLYKPIVLVCGHASCFWCCQRSMRMQNVSYCPLCRHPYHHFPAICRTLHFLLKKLYPVSYDRRSIQILEYEKHSTLGYSPDIDNIDPSTEEKKLTETSDRTCNQVSVSDVLCVGCKQLLYRPVVLNCGHVYCESCITIPTEGTLKCQVCVCRHPNGLPKVCRELDNYLEEQFASEYALRKSTIQVNQEQTENRNALNEVSTQNSMLSFPTEENFHEWWTVHGSKFHPWIGCDSCGMSPIIGDRYRCKDCPEKCGYDLCGDCYISGSNLPGRFHQKHTSTHRLELQGPMFNENVMYLLMSGQAELFVSRASTNQSRHANTIPDLPSPSFDEDGASATTEEQFDSQPPI